MNEIIFTVYDDRNTAEWIRSEILELAYRPLIPDRNVWQWADDDNVYLDIKAARQPGFYRSRKTPHVREFCETFTDPEWLEDLVIKSSRSGFTEAAFNILRFMPRHAPGHALFAIDSTKEIKSISKDRLSPTMKSAAGEEWPEDPDDAGTLTIYLRNMTLFLSGSYSPGIFRNKWLRAAFLDEVEVKSEIDEEGSTLDLAESRLKHEGGDGKLFAMSKPKRRGTHFHKRWCSGTRSVRLLPCPCCGTHQELTFFGASATDYLKPETGPNDPPSATWSDAQRLGKVRFDHCKDLTGDWDKERLVKETYYECINGCRIDFDAPFTQEHLEKPWVGESFSDEVRQGMAAGELFTVKQAMVLSGHWLRTNPKNHPGRRSRHISDLYSLYDDLSIGHLALMWIDCQGDTTKIQHFYNNNLGLVYSKKTTAIDENLVLELRAEYDRKTCPFQPDLVLLNFDTQQHHYAAIITAWLLDGTCAIIDWFDALADVDILNRFDEDIPPSPQTIHKLTENRTPVRPQYGMGDAAGYKGRTADVYDLVFKRPSVIYASFGRGNLQIRTPISQGTATHRMVDFPIYMFSDDTFKTRLYEDRIGRIRKIKQAQREGKDPTKFGLPPRLYAPRDMDAKLLAELSNERRKPDGSWQDPPPGPNHLGDALKLAFVQYEYLLPRLRAEKERG